MHPYALFDVSVAAVRSEQPNQDLTEAGSSTPCASKFAQLNEHPLTVSSRC